MSIKHIEKISIIILLTVIFGEAFTVGYLTADRQPETIYVVLSGSPAKVTQNHTEPNATTAFPKIESDFYWRGDVFEGFQNWKEVDHEKV